MRERRGDRHQRGARGLGVLRKARRGSLPRRTCGRSAPRGSRSHIGSLRRAELVGHDRRIRPPPDRRRAGARAPRRRGHRGARVAGRVAPPAGHPGRARERREHGVRAREDGARGRRHRRERAGRSARRRSEPSRRSRHRARPAAARSAPRSRRAGPAAGRVDPAGRRRRARRACERARDSEPARNRVRAAVSDSFWLAVEGLARRRRGDAVGRPEDRHARRHDPVRRRRRSARRRRRSSMRSTSASKG